MVAFAVQALAVTLTTTPTNLRVEGSSRLIDRNRYVSVYAGSTAPLVSVPALVDDDIVESISNADMLSLTTRLRRSFGTDLIDD